MSIEYRGERFSGYNKPKRTPNKSKKFAVLAKQGSQVKLVRFGDPNMSIKKNDPKDEKVSEQDTDATQAHPRNLAQDIGVAKSGEIFRYQNNWLGQRRIPIDRIKGRNRHGIQTKSKIFIKTPWCKPNAK